MPRYTAEQWFRGILRGPAATRANSAPNQWAGLTTVLSGVATGVVSTTAVDSDSLVFFSQAAVAATNVLSGQSRTWEVKSINTGLAFTFGTTDGAGMSRDTVVHWMLWRTK